MMRSVLLLALAVGLARAESQCTSRRVPSNRSYVECYKYTWH